MSAVVPCFNEEEVLSELHRRLSATLESVGVPYEIVLVDDGSRDRTWEMLQDLRGRDPHLKIVKLARNFGHQLALTCGLDQAHGSAVIILDADLQDPPELLHDMLKLWQQGYDVVYGKRQQRAGESISKKVFAFLFYRIFARVTGFELPSDSGDFRLMDRRAVDLLQAMKERHRFIRGMVSWIGLNQTPLEYKRPERFAGTTKYPFKKSLFLAIDAITSFSYAPLRMASYLGAMISALAFLYILVVIVLKLRGINFPGYTSIMASMLLLGGVQLVVLGLIGEYVGRIFEQGQSRPLYLVDRVVGEPLQNGK
ncbi:MAG: glycosyltransferase family 2 protein [Oligoflexia bacterium]|nr:glycosyltransferase family 2 protein [Oligoflexia bacterium]